LQKSRKNPMKMATIKFNKKFQSLTRREEAKYEGSN
jgi:hypothetical protein